MNRPHRLPCMAWIATLSTCLFASWLLPSATASAESRADLLIRDSQTNLIRPATPEEIADHVAEQASHDALPQPRTVQQMSPREIDAMIAQLRRDTPDLRSRMLQIAQRTLGQPFEIYVLGEYPFQLNDGQPTFNHAASDALTWIEQTAAMALADDWPTYYAWLQRIRYDNGHVGVATRNHFTEAQWNPNNAWLYDDITATLPGASTYEVNADLAEFLKTRFNVHTDRPALRTTASFLPWSAAAVLNDHLQTGDVIQYVTAGKGKRWVNTLAMIEVDNDGTLWKYQPYAGDGLRRVALDHDFRNYPRQAQHFAEVRRRITEQGGEISPQVEQQSIEGGLIILRLREDAADQLRQLDGPNAPTVIFAPYSPQANQSDGQTANADP
ncbi:MAG: N-acetylmuramoyl-L-alanine amidase-like domain-containing protein [Planctomycetota bacterium]